MKKITQVITGMLVLTFMSVGFVAQAQTRSNNQSLMNDNRSMMKVAMRLETQTDWFKDSLAAAFDNNRVDDTELEDEVMGLVKGFELAADRYVDRVEDNEVIALDVEGLLSRALLIEGIMSKVPASEMANRDWTQIKQTLDQITKTNNVVWVWTLTANPFWKTAAVEPIYDRLDTRSDEFLNSFRYAIDFSKLNGTKLEDEAIELIRKFEDNMDMLETRVDNAGAITSVDMNKVIQQGMVIEAFLRTHNLSPRVRRDWSQVKASLRELAMRSNVAWTWTYKPVVTKSASN
jgi:hypothetical protein